MRWAGVRSWLPWTRPAEPSTRYRRSRPRTYPEIGLGVQRRPRDRYPGRLTHLGDDLGALTLKVDGPLSPARPDGAAVALGRPLGERVALVTLVGIYRQLRAQGAANALHRMEALQGLFESARQAQRHPLEPPLI